MTVRVALLGAGSWGQNLLRVLVESTSAEVVAVADPCPTARARATRFAAGSVVVEAADASLFDRVDAVVIAAPAGHHASLTLAALEAGVDVLVEKPLALTVADAERCAARAGALGRVAMVGHLLRYHPTVTALVELARSGELGDLRHAEAARLSRPADLGARVAAARGQLRASDPLWTLGPHDLSILLALEPGGIAGVTLARPRPDHLVLDVRLASRATARIELSEAHPTKERRLAVFGSRRAVFFDDVRAPDLLRVADAGGSGVTREIRVPWREPLAVEVEHFLRCVRDRVTPLTPLDEGAAVVRALAAAERGSELETTPSAPPRPVVPRSAPEPSGA